MRLHSLQWICLKDRHHFHLVRAGDVSTQPANPSRLIRT
jgi:hypothetical protein